MADYLDIEHWTMWLLSTDRAELHYFQRSFDAIGGYAILSHTWDGEEQSFQQVRAIVERCQVKGTNPRDDPELSSKIRECCILAEKHGYRWVWIDSCCINKESSSELSEAINSMYKWYKSSEVCFAYLKDVPHDDDLEAPNSKFRESRWHTRGWTLQELIAPDSVIFLSDDWRELGHRAGLALLLQEITRVPFGILTGRRRPAEYSACIRMSWASKRRTKRTEDEAYCLMGLFGVSMPTNYGEGKRAFIRLQYEIMQHKECDMTLFAFGNWLDQDDIVRGGIVLDNHGSIDRDNPWHYLLSDSPRSFRSAFGYIPHLGNNAKQQYPPPLDPTKTGPFDRVELPHATATSYGIQFRLPLATVDSITIAVMLCQASGRHIGLFLTRDDRGEDPQKPRYFVGCPYTTPGTGSARYLARMCDLGDDLYNLTLHRKRIEASWCTIYIIPTASDLASESSTSPNLFINCSPLSQFRIPRWVVDRFIALQFDVDELVYTNTLNVVRFLHRSEGVRIFVSFGMCTEYNDPGKPPLLWSKLFVTAALVLNPEEYTHDCTEDHLDCESWATHSKVFGDASNAVRLSLRTLSTRVSETTPMHIHLELCGPKFKAMLETGISFPSLADLEGESSHSTPDAPVISSIIDTPSEARGRKEGSGWSPGGSPAERQNEESLG